MFHYRSVVLVGKTGILVQKLFFNLRYVSMKHGRLPTPTVKDKTARKKLTKYLSGNLNAGKDELF